MESIKRLYLCRQHRMASLARTDRWMSTV